MKSTSLLLGSLSLLCLGSFAQASAETIENVVCRVDGEKVHFELVEKSGSAAITDALAKIDNEASLVYHFNPYYDIGGRVQFRTADTSETLVSWGSNHEPSKTQGRVIYQESIVECRLL